MTNLYVKKSLPSVSIIIPTFNEQAHLKTCLNSIFDLSYPLDKIEIIVVDDGSRDNTVNIALSYKVKIIKLNHSGRSFARNIGVSQAHGNIIAFIDADDVCKREWLSETISMIDNEKIAAIGCSHDILNQTNNDFVILSYKDRIFRHNKSHGKTDHIGCSGMVVKKDIFLKVGGFNILFSASEDAELSYRLRKEGYDLILINKPLISVTYPNGLYGYIFNQVRNSAYLVYFIFSNPKKISGNKYGGLNDYVQSIIPIVSLFFSIITYLFFKNPNIIFLFLFYISFLLLMINKDFLRFINLQHNDLSKYWFINSCIYLFIRSIVWNFALFYSLFLIIKIQKNLN